MFILLLNNEMRNNKTSFRVLALLLDFDAKSREVKASTCTKQSNKGISIRNYHKCLKVTLFNHSRRLSVMEVLEHT
jgi:hypothetical protein